MLSPARAQINPSLKTAATTSAVPKHTYKKINGISFYFIENSEVPNGSISKLENKVSASMKKIAGTNSGQQLLKRLRQAKVIIKAYPGKKEKVSMYYPLDGARNSAGKMALELVWGEKPSYQDDVVLAHELRHGLNAAEGTISKDIHVEERKTTGVAQDLNNDRIIDVFEKSAHATYTSLLTPAQTPLNLDANSHISNFEMAAFKVYGRHSYNALSENNYRAERFEQQKKAGKSTAGYERRKRYY